MRAGAGPDKIFLRVGVGQNLAGESGTEKSVPRRSLVQFYVFFKKIYELLTNVMFLHLFQS